MTLPPALRAALPFAEPALTGAGALWLAVLGGQALWAGSVAAVLPLAGAAVLGAWCVAAARRLRLARRRAAEPVPGVVQIAEGRIGYFGPESGGFAALDAIAAVAVEAAPGGRIARWHLIDAEGRRLAIPGGAVGAERLPDVLSALPGFDPAAVSRAVPEAEGALATVWRAGPGPRALPG